MDVNAQKGRGPPRINGEYRRRNLLCSPAAAESRTTKFQIPDFVAAELKWRDRNALWNEDWCFMSTNAQYKMLRPVKHIPFRCIIPCARYSSVVEEVAKRNISVESMMISHSKFSLILWYSHSIQSLWNKSKYVSSCHRHHRLSSC